MIDHLEYAIEAVKARRAGSYLFSEFILELEAAGLTSSRINDLMAKAKSMVPHPEAPRALRVLRASAKAARRGDAERCERLYKVAQELLGDEEELFVIVEEHRLSFRVLPQPAEPSRGVRHGFALV